MEEAGLSTLAVADTAEYILYVGRRLEGYT